MGSLRIAVALPHLGVYGGIRRFLELGNVWVERGHEVALLTASPEGGDRPWIPFRGRIGAFDTLSTERWDLLLSPDPELFVRCESPGALRVYYSVLEGAPAEARALERADLVLANSAGMRRYLARKGVSAADAAGGVNVRWFCPPASDPRPWRARAKGTVHALVYGRLSRRRKGTWTAALAVERAAKSAGVPVALTLFDAPPEGSAAPMTPRALAIPHRWVLDPSQEELRDLYRDADLFVSAERRAGWCNTAAEAIACGAALVCTPSGTEDFAVDLETAAVSRWPWAWLLARAVKPLLVDPARRAALAARGRARIQEFSWERTADRIERAIESALGGRNDAGETKPAV